MALIEKRYAEALLDVSMQRGETYSYRLEFGTIVDAYKSQPDFRLFLRSPEIKAADKKEIIRRSLEGKVRKEVLNFIMLLIDKGRIIFLPGIFDEFSRLADLRGNILHISITSAVPLEETHLERIKDKYRVLYKASSVKAEVEIDKTLIGGVKVRIGDKVIDGSVKGRLEELGKIIIES